MNRVSLLPRGIIDTHHHKDAMIDAKSLLGILWGTQTGHSEQQERPIAAVSDIAIKVTCSKQS